MIQQAADTAFRGILHLSSACETKRSALDAVAAMPQWLYPPQPDQEYFTHCTMRSPNL